MKRLMLIGAVLLALGTLTLAGTRIAGAGTAGPSRVLVSPHDQPAVSVTVGSQWTLYSLEPGSTYCLGFISFGASKIFSDDAGNNGKWTSSAKTTKITYTGGALAGVVAKLTWVSFPSLWDGNATIPGGDTRGPWVLEPGYDPLGMGSC